MGKKIIGVIAFAAIAVAAAWNYQQNKQSVEPSNLMLGDIEATAMCEVTKGDKVRLKCDGDGTCSTSYMGHTLTCDGKKVAL